jgi:tripartite-type tricarboxylate transporter receptor subunit TctC
MKALAVTSRSRSPSLPNVPTLDELGIAGYEASTFTGLFGPAGVPPPVSERLYLALRKALADDGVRERFRSMGVDIADLSQVEFAAYVRTDFKKWRQVARERNIVVE